MSQVTAGASLQANTRLFSKPFVGKFKYEFTNVETGSDQRPYSESHKILLGGLFHLTENQSSGIYTQMRKDDFEYEGFEPVISSRDADRVEAGLTYSFHSEDNKTGLDWKLAYEENRAMGLNFNRTAYKAGVTLRLPLVAQWNMRLSIDYEDHEYSDFVGPVMRVTEIYQYSLAFTCRFGKHLFARLRVSERDEESSYANLTYDRITWGLDLSYVY
ncbi:MAG: hypothetical protein ACI8P9_001748 [Parasphingorhabdus sp.]